MKVAINRCYGGFGLSQAAYARLIELGIPVRPYIEPTRDRKGLYQPEPANEGEIIFDSKYPGHEQKDWHLGRYWDTWVGKDRTHTLVLQVIEELGKKASGKLADLVIVEIPDGVKYEIDEYDGIEHISEVHRTWS